MGVSLKRSLSSLSLSARRVTVRFSPHSPQAVPIVQPYKIPAARPEKETLLSLAHDLHIIYMSLSLSQRKLGRILVHSPQIMTILSFLEILELFLTMIIIELKQAL